jgi:RimJ/RimL family protein N-acetyltransferase
MKNAYATGNSIYLRAPTTEDVHGKWHEWLSDPEITKYLADRYLPNSLENQMDFFKSLGTSKDRIVFSICTIENDEHIGICGFSSINWFHRYADITYVLGNSDLVGGTVISEVVKLLLEIAFVRLNLENLISDHAASQPVTPLIDKMFGFKNVGILKNYVYVDGKKDDLVKNQLTKADWLERNQVD